MSKTLMVRWAKTLFDMFLIFVVLAAVLLYVKEPGWIAGISFGVGLAFADLDNHGMLFSSRKGDTK
jgi:hypothetical protein